MPTNASDDFADELDRRAAALEAEVQRLRDAAAVLRGKASLAPTKEQVRESLDRTAEQVRSNAEAVALRDEQTARRAVAAAEVWQGRRLTEADYLRVLRSFDPATEWNADQLATELRKVGQPVASLDAVRTALARLHDRDYLERVRHGFYKLTELGQGGSVP